MLESSFFIFFLFCSTFVVGQQTYRTTQFSFDCTSSLVLDESGVYFHTSSCKGSSHISYGRWVFNAKDSTLKISSKKLKLIKEVKTKSYLDNKSIIVLRDFYNEKFISPSNFHYKLKPKKKPWETTSYQYSSDSLKLNPQKYEAVKIEFWFGRKKEVLKLKVESGKKVSIQLGIPNAVMGYRGSELDQSPWNVTYLLKYDGIYTLEGKKIMK